MTNLATMAVPGCDGTSVSVLEAHGEVTTVGASEQRTVQLDELQYEVQEGPCLSAIRTATTLQVDDFNRDIRLPAFARATGSLDVASCPSVPSASATTLAV